jgi:hypothetical protein
MSAPLNRATQATSAKDVSADFEYAETVAERSVLCTRTTALAALVVWCCLAPAAWAQAGPAAGKAAAPQAQRKPLSLRQVKLTEKAKKYYVTAWGVEKLKVSYTSSGNLIRFSYRVADPERAKLLADKKATPYLLGQRSRALLHVPVMDKVGQLRQAATPQAGQEYWMVFSNKGNLIKPGDRVNVMIGAFHADGLVVEGS